MSNIRGIINLIKPVGISSFRAVKDIKKIANVKKAGHTGTLDLLATGVLPICINKATKVIPFLNEITKEYIAEIILGKATRTLDKEGEIIKQNDNWKNLRYREIEQVINSFKGQLKQIPPMYSALHHKGKRLYKLAREGKSIKRSPRNINIYSINISKIDLPVIRLKIKCSKGTYIRALARDIGENLKVGAYLSFLIRTRSGPFTIEEAVTFTELNKKNDDIFNNLTELDFYLDYPAFNVKNEALKKAVNGNILQENDFNNRIEDIEQGDLIMVYSPEDEFISINKFDVVDNVLIFKPERVFI